MGGKLECKGASLSKQFGRHGIFPPDKNQPGRKRRLRGCWLPLRPPTLGACKSGGIVSGSALRAPSWREADSSRQPGGGGDHQHQPSANRSPAPDRRGVSWKIFRDIDSVNRNSPKVNVFRGPLSDCGLLEPATPIRTMHREHGSRPGPGAVKRVLQAGRNLDKPTS